MRLPHRYIILSASPQAEHGTKLKEITNNQGIIDAAIAGGVVSNEGRPTIICVVGRSGSGKSTFISDKIGKEFIRLDAGLLFFEVGGEKASEFPDSLEDDVNEAGSAIARESLAQKFDLVIEFSGADTVRMQMLMRALADIGYEVEIKYVKVDLPQASIWNADRENNSVPAQETDDYHFEWLIEGINSLHSDVDSSSRERNSRTRSILRRNLIASIFGGLKSKTNNPHSSEAAQLIMEQFLEFSAGDDSLIRSAANMPTKKSIVLSAFELLMARARTSEKPTVRDDVSALGSNYRSVFDYQDIESFDVKLIDELGDQPSERDIAIRLTKEDLTSVQEEDLELIRMNRKRLVQKYTKRAELEYMERTRSIEESRSLTGHESGQVAKS